MRRCTVEMEIEFPDEVEFREYQRLDQGHGFHVAWTLPERCRCETCREDAAANLTYRNTFQVVRDLDISGLPSFYLYQPPVHQCRKCGHRQYVLPPFKRKDVKYTYRFEEQVLLLLRGSTEKEVADRLGISAETVALIVRLRMAEAQAMEIEPQRQITDVGLDELSLKKRHKLYATILTDLTDSQQPRVLAVAKGKDEAAAQECLSKLTPEQRQGVRWHRTDMSPAYLAACRELLPKSQSVIDRFHVAQRVGAECDRWRKKNHAGLQENADQAGIEDLPFAHVGVSPTLLRLEA